MEDVNPASIASDRDASLSSFQQWIIKHDHSLVFNVFYIGLAVTLSVWLGLFWLVAIVGIHGLIELYRQHINGFNLLDAFLEAIWEIKLDLGLIVFAFWLGIYLDFIFGMAGLSAGARVVAQTGGRVAQAGTRAAAWQRIIRGVFITLDDVGLAFKALGKRKHKKNGQSTEPVEQENIRKTSWSGSYSGGDWFSIVFLVVFATLIAAAPLLTFYTIGDVLQILLEEMRPFS